MATRQYRTAKKPAETSAPAVFLRRWRTDENAPSVLEWVVASSLERGEDLREKGDSLGQVIQYLNLAKTATQMAAAIMHPYDGGALSIIKDLDKQLEVARGDVAMRAAQRSDAANAKRRGAPSDTFRKHAIEVVARELGSSSPKCHFGLLINPPAADDFPKVVGEFVAAVAYTNKIDCHGSWPNLKKRYQQHARRLLCATGNATPGCSTR